MRIKELKKMICVIAAILIIVPISAFGVVIVDKPSDWAEGEVAAAIDEGLVPEELQGNYQENIKRYQYVLLALKAYELAGITMEIKEPKPFTDTVNHPYEQVITQAFNAQIVKGDGKGNFHPDDDITREEISSLVVNLLRQVSPQKNFSLQGSYTFADEDQISGWAKEYIGICYENNILNGVGSNQMAPKGSATVEQSIALIYRLVQKEALASNEFDKRIKLDSTFNKQEYPDKQTVEDFIAIYGEDIFSLICELAEDPANAVSDMRGESIAFIINQKNTINLDGADQQISLSGLMHDMGDESSVAVFRQLMETFKDAKQGLDLFDNAMDSMSAGLDVNLYENINESSIFSIETLKDDSNTSYLIHFIER